MDRGMVKKNEILTPVNKIAAKYNGYTLNASNKESRVKAPKKSKAAMIILATRDCSGSFVLSVFIA